MSPPLRSLLPIATLALSVVPVWAEGNAPRVRLKHAAAVTSLAFSPDGKTLATGDADSIVRLWDVAAASEVRHLQSAARPSTVLALAFRRDGKTLVAGNSNGTATLWRLATDKKYHDVDPKIYRCLSLATDGSLAVTGREDGTVGLWTPGGEDPIREIKFGDTIWHTAVLPDSNLVGIIHGKTTAMAPAPDRVLSIVDASTAKELRQFRVGGTGLKLCRAARMAATFSAASIYVWEMPTGKLRVAFRAATADAVFSPDGRFLAAADAEESAVCIYDLVEGKKAFLVGEKRPFPHAGLFSQRPHARRGLRRSYRVPLGPSCTTPTCREALGERTGTALAGPVGR